MNENFTAKHIDNDSHFQTKEESEYEYLINRLQEIRKTISILEKSI